MVMLELCWVKKVVREFGIFIIFPPAQYEAIIRRNKGIDRYRTDFSQGFFCITKLFVKNYTKLPKISVKKVILKARFKVTKN